MRRNRFIENYFWGSESPGVLEYLCFIPKGWQRVAGGRSFAETTEVVRNENRILKGCQKQ